MAKSEKSAQKSKRDKYLQNKTKAEPTYKSAQFIEDSSSASEAPTPLKKKTPVGSTSEPLSTPSTKASLQNGNATKREMHEERKKSSDTRTVLSEGDRVEHEEVIQEGASKEKDRVNGLGSTTEDSDGSAKERSPQPESNNRHPKSVVENAVPSTKVSNPEASAAVSPTSSDSEEDDVDVLPATALEGKEDAVESHDENDEVEHQGGTIGSEAGSDAPGEEDSGEEASESETAASSDVEKPVSKAPPTPSAHTQRPIPAYQAPPDFDLAAISLGDAPNAENLLSPARLEGKELWHIILPSSVPVSALKEIPSQSLLDGSNILSHDESDFGLVPHREVDARSLLILSYADGLFTPVKTAFAKSLRLQQLVKVPSHAVNPEHGTSSSEVTRKKRNQQPEGLRMRYQPFGIPDSSGADLGTDLDPDEQHVSSKQREKEAPQFKPPPEPLVEDSARKKEKKKKRKHGEIASSAPVTPSSSQMKRAKQEHPNLDATSPPLRSSALVPTPISRPGNSQPVMQTNPEDPITITNASPMHLEQGTVGAPSANPSPSKKHGHKLQSSPPVTPAHPEHDVSSTSNKASSNKSRHKGTKSEEKHRNKLLQPFRVPHSVSPAQTPANGTSPEEALPTTTHDIVTPHVDLPAADLGANSTSTDAFDDRHATAGASPHGPSQRPKKKKKTRKSNAESLPLPSLPETATPLSGGVKVRDFVKASDLRGGGDVDTAAASKPSTNDKVMEASSLGIDGRRGVRKQASESQADSTPTAADTRIGERDVDALSPIDLNASKDVVMQDVDSKPTDSPLDDAAERERKKQRKKALKEARKKSMGELKSDPIQSNGMGGVTDNNVSSFSLGVTKDAVVEEDSTMQNDSQLLDATERVKKERGRKARKERKESIIAAEVKPVQAASPETASVSTTVNHDTASKGHVKTNSQLYEESERARKKMEKDKTKKEKGSAQAKGGETSANMSTSSPVTAAKDPTADERDAAPTNPQPQEETTQARRKRERKERKDRTNEAKEAEQPSHNPAPTLTSAGQDTTANQDTPAPTNSQLYYEGERARKQRENRASNHEDKPGPTTSGGGGEPAPAHNVAPLNEWAPPPPTNGLTGNDPSPIDAAAARAQRKQEKAARKEERRRLKAVNAAAGATTADE